MDSVVAHRVEAERADRGSGMKKATRQFNSQEIKAIEAAIGEVERATSAEVVPVVASSSGRYDRAEDVFAFFFALLALFATWNSIQRFTSFGEAWGEPSLLNSSFPIVILVLVIAFAIGIALASRLTFLRLPFITQREMAEEVESQARETFQRLKIRNTANSTGILIYISLYEHRVQVVGDDSINEKLSPSDWEEIRDMVISGFKQGNAAEGLCSGIRRAGELLAHHFPIEDDDKNELPNKLHLID